MAALAVRPVSSPGLRSNTLPPLYRQVQQRYDAALENERTAKDNRIATLEAQTQSLSSNSAAEAARLRAKGERAAQEAEKAAEQRVREIDQERARLEREHRLALQAIEEAIQRNRSEADIRLQQVGEEALELHAKGDAEVAKIAAQRDAAVRASRERCAVAENSGQEAATRAEQVDREIAAKTRQAIREEETQRVRTVDQAKKSLDIWLKHYEAQSSEMLERVSKRIVELLQEARTARDILLENRERADGHMRHQISVHRSETEGQREVAAHELGNARIQLQNAKENAAEAAVMTAKALMEKDGLRRAELQAVADQLEKKVRRAKVLEEPEYIQALEELARQLRAGQF